MSSSLRRKRFLAVFSMTLAASLSGCSDTVVLGDAEGTVELRYDCDSFQPAAMSRSEQSVVRQFAALAVRSAGDSGDTGLVQAIRKANAAGDVEGLERILVEHLCREGPPVESISNRQSIARASSELRTGAGFDESGLDLGVEAPQFRLPVLNQAYFDENPSYEGLSDYFGTHVLLTFGGPWCPPCVQEMTALVPIWERYRERGLTVFEILYKDTPENGWRWNQEHVPGAFPTLVDEDFLVAAEYEVEGVPRTYIIGPAGEVLWSSEGWGPHMPAELSEVLDHLLQGAS